MAEMELFDNDYTEVLSSLVALNMFTGCLTWTVANKDGFEAMTKGQEHKYFCGIEIPISHLSWPMSQETLMLVCKRAAERAVNANVAAKSWEVFVYSHRQKRLFTKTRFPYYRMVTDRCIAFMGLRDSGAYKNSNPSHAK